jgi:hypothetical protein
MTMFREIEGFYDLPDTFMVFEYKVLFECDDRRDTIVKFVKVSETEAGIRYRREIGGRTRIVEENGFIPIDWAMKINDRQLCVRFLATMTQAEIEHAAEMAEEHRFVWDLFGIEPARP